MRASMSAAEEWGRMRSGAAGKDGRREGRLYRVYERRGESVNSEEYTRSQLVAPEEYNPEIDARSEISILMRGPGFRIGLN